MINLLIGPPGGGKSYEAVVYHILPALNKGRKVITNLPLDLDRLAALGFPVELVEMREKTLAEERTEVMSGITARLVKPWTDRCFAHAEDYGDKWRHPTDGSGPLYVIDECHLALPARETERAVEEWFSLHRHESADVLLITQSYGKVSRAIIDLVQVCYRVKKGTAFGTEKHYIRKVQDGVRGEVVNTTVRTYEKRYFGLYKSHTRGGGAELSANDIIPIWKRWPFLGAAAAASLLFAIFAFTDVKLNPIAQATASVEKAKPIRVVEEVDGRVVSDTASPSEVVAAAPAEPSHPYAHRALHIVGSYTTNGRTRVLFAVSQNGQVVSNVDSFDLLRLGYEVETPTPCAVKVVYDTWSSWIICDAPQIAVTPTGSKTAENAG